MLSLLDFSLALGDVAKDVSKGVEDDASLLRHAPLSQHGVGLPGARLTVGKDGAWRRRRKLNI